MLRYVVLNYILVGCPCKNLIHMIQYRKCKSTLNTPAEYVGQLTERALGDRFGEHCRAIQNSTSIKRTQNYRHRSYPTRTYQRLWKENPYVESRTFLHWKDTNYAATRNKQRGRPLNHLFTYWLHYYHRTVLIYLLLLLLLIY